MKIKHFFLALAVVVLAACGKDPVTSDLKSFEQIGAEIFQQSELQTLNAKMMRVKTNEERAALLDEIIVFMQKQKQAIQTFKPESVEVKGITDTIIKGYDEGIDASSKAKEAFLKADQTALQAATQQLNQAQKTIQSAVRDLIKLAKDKGYKWTT